VGYSTDHVIEYRRPDIVVVDKDNNWALLIDISQESQKDTIVDEKEQENVDRYQDLPREIKRLWEVKAGVIPIVIDAFGTIPRGLETNLRTLGIKIKNELIQKVALLGTARILRKLLEYCYKIVKGAGTVTSASDIRLVLWGSGGKTSMFSSRSWLSRIAMHTIHSCQYSHENPGTY